MATKLANNPFMQEASAAPIHDSEGSLDKEFQDTIANPDEADGIAKANATPSGWYTSDPETRQPTIFTQVREDEDGSKTGVKGSRRIGTILARCTQVYKREEYTSLIRVEISPDARAKRLWENEEFSGFHPSKHDGATRMYSEAQGLYKAARGSNATSVTALLEFLQETPFRVQCMARDDGSLVAYKLAAVGRNKRG